MQLYIYSRLTKLTKRMPAINYTEHYKIIKDALI